MSSRDGFSRTTISDGTEHPYEDIITCVYQNCPFLDDLGSVSHSVLRSMSDF